MTEFSVFTTFQRMTPGNSWIEGVSLKGYKIIWKKKKNKGNENKIILEHFNSIMDKMDRDGENKTQRL